MTTPAVPQQVGAGRRQKNYRLHPDLIDRIAAHAERQGVSETAAASALLTEAVTLAELRAGITAVAVELGAAAGAAMRDLVTSVEHADADADADGEPVPAAVRELAGQLDLLDGEDDDGAGPGETTKSSGSAPSAASRTGAEG